MVLVGPFCLKDKREGVCGSCLLRVTHTCMAKGQFWDGLIVVHFGFLAWAGDIGIALFWFGFGVAGVIEGRSQRDTMNMQSLVQFLIFRFLAVQFM